MFTLLPGLERNKMKLNEILKKIEQNPDTFHHFFCSHGEIISKPENNFITYNDHQIPRFQIDAIINRRIRSEIDYYSFISTWYCKLEEEKKLREEKEKRKIKTYLARKKNCQKRWAKIKSKINKINKFVDSLSWTELVHLRRILSLKRKKYEKTCENKQNTDIN